MREPLGAYERTVPTPLPALARAALAHPGKAVLLVDAGRRDVPPETYALAGGDSVLVGRDSRCDVRILDASVSRMHARIERRDRDLFAHDMGSRNGLWVNGRRVESVKLASGDVIGVGSRRIDVHVGCPAAGSEGRLDEHLERMPALRAVVASHPGVLRTTKIFLVHHMTSEVLGLIAALRTLGCRDLEVQFVLYAGETPSSYLEDLAAIPSTELHTFAVEHRSDRDGLGSGSFSLSSRYSEPRDRELITPALERSRRPYFEAMRLAGVFRFVRMLQRAEREGARCLLIEDGGYIAPFLNDASLLGASVQDVVRAVDSGCDDARPMRALLERTLLGTVEHTRSGHDRLAAVVDVHGALAAPAVSIAISKYKVERESFDVAATVLNGIENVLHVMGKTLSRRQCLVLGSRGVVGRAIVRTLSSRLALGTEQIVGVDPCADRECDDHAIDEASSVDALSDERLTQADLIIGVVGRSSFSQYDLLRWLLGERTQELTLVSGSSKTDEFAGVLAWLDELGASRGAPCFPGESTSEPPPVRLMAVESVVDPKTDSVVAQRLRLRISATGREKSIVLMAKLMPINFLFYGVPTETIDGVLARLLESAVHVVERAEGDPLSCRLHTVDHDLTLPERT